MNISRARKRNRSKLARTSTARRSRFEQLELRRVLASVASIDPITDHAHGEATMMISDDGGVEGSNQRLELGTKLGATVQYSYEHFRIPDNFIIRYEGRNLLETGFTGGSASGTIDVPAGNSDFVQVIVATNDSGTAWNYTASAEGCVAPKPYVVESLTGDFQAAADGTCSATGSFSIGHSRGLSDLIRVENGTVSFDDTTITVAGTIYSQIGVGDIRSDALFAGSFKLSSSSPVASDFVDNDAAGGFQIGGRDTKFIGLTVNPNTLNLGIEAEAPTGFGLDDLVLSGPDGLIVSSNDVRLAPSFTFSTPDLKDVNLFGFVKASFENISLEYDATQNAIFVRGKVTLDLLSKSPIKQLSADFAGDNYIALREGDFDVVGQLKAVVDLKFPGGWGISELTLDIDTVKNDISGTGKFILPFRGKISAEATVGFKIPLQPLELNKLSLTVDNLNIPIPGYPLVFFQSFDIGVENFASSDSDPIELMGGIGLTLGPQVLLFGQTYFLLRGDLDVVGSDEQIEGTGTLVVGGPSIGDDQLATLTGSSTLNWDKKFLENKSSLNVFDGFITSQSSFKATSDFDVKFGGGAAISVPKSVPFIGGYQLASGNYQFNFSNDGNSSNDFAAGWGTINIKKFGFEASLVVGAQLNFDGSLKRIGSKNIPPVGSFDIPANTPWFTMSANWETNGSNVDLVVIKPDGTRLSEAEFESNNVFIVDELDLDNAKTVIVFDAEAGIWDLEVADPTGLGEVTYAASEEAAAPTIEINSVSSDARQLSIDYTAFDVDSQATIQFFVDDDQAGFDGFPVGALVNEADGSAVAEITVDQVTSGPYFVYAVIQDGDNPPVYAYSSQSTTVATAADLAVSLQSTPSFTVGETATVTVTVENLGDAEATNAIGLLSLPTDVTLTAADVNFELLSDGQIKFDLGSVAASDSNTIELTISADASLTSVPVGFEVSSESFDSQADNDADFLLLDVEAAPVQLSDLRVETISLPTSADVGERLTYVLRVTNGGPEAASEVQLVDLTPTNARVIGASSTVGTTAITGQQVLAMLGDVNPGDVIDISIEIETTSAGPLINVSTVSTDGNDMNLRDNSIFTRNDAIAVAPAAADLSLTVTVDTERISIGDTTQVTVLLTNTGPGVSSGVQVTAPVPTGFELVSSFAAQGAYDTTTGIWSVGNVRDNLSRGLTLNLTALQATTAKFSAEVTSVGEADPDSTPGNAASEPQEDDSGSVNIQVGQSSRIYVPQLVARPHLIAGDEVRTAVLFRAAQDTTVTVSPIGTVSFSESVQILDRDLNPMGGYEDGIASADLVAGGLYSILFDASTEERLYTVRSSAGYQALTGSPTNLFSPTDTNADGQTSPMDLLTVLNQLQLERTTFNASAQGETATRSSFFTDVSGDGETTPLDALMVINRLQKDAGRLRGVALGEEVSAVLSLPNVAAEELEEVRVHNIALSFDSSSDSVLSWENELVFESVDVNTSPGSQEDTVDAAIDDLFASGVALLS